MRKREEEMKYKEEEETLFTDNYLCVSAYTSCHNELIREENKNADKETKEHKEKWKDQAAAKQKRQAVQLKTLRINKNNATAGINEKRKEISNLNQRMVMLKE